MIFFKENSLKCFDLAGRYFTLFTKDSIPNFSQGVSDSIGTIDTIPPDEVTIQGVTFLKDTIRIPVKTPANSDFVGIRAMYDLRVNPGANFSVNWTAYLIFITVIGGIGTIEGPIIGTVIFYVLRETTSKYGTWYFIALGLVAIVVTVWSPQGIYGWIVKKTGFMIFPLQRQLNLFEDDVGGGRTPGGGPGPRLPGIGRARKTGTTPKKAEDASTAGAADGT